jgi:hypothetical protein
MNLFQLQRIIFIFAAIFSVNLTKITCAALFSASLQIARSRPRSMHIQTSTAQSRTLERRSVSTISHFAKCNKPSSLCFLVGIPGRPFQVVSSTCRTGNQGYVTMSMSMSLSLSTSTATSTRHPKPKLSPHSSRPERPLNADQSPAMCNGFLIHLISISPSHKLPVSL